MRQFCSCVACTIALCLSASVACSDAADTSPRGAAGEGSGASGGEGSGATSAGGETSGAGHGPGPTSGLCEPESEAETLVADIGAPTAWFAASDEGVAYSTRVNAAEPTDLMVLVAGASEPELVYTSPTRSAVESIAWSGTDLVFTEAVDGTIPARLFRVASTGGDAEQIGTDTFSSGRLIGADESFAYLHDDGTPGTLVRVDLAAGTSEVIGEVPGGGVLQPSLSGSELFFVAGAGLQTVWRLPTDATGAEAEEVFVANPSGGCGFPLGGLVATPTKLVCGYMNAFAYAREGGAPEEQILEGDPTKPATHLVAASSGELVYMVGQNDGTVDTALLRARSDGSDETAVICDMGKVADQLASASFPIFNQPQIGVSGDSIYWVEQRLDEETATLTHSLRRAPL
jgi:hypothetical protein